MKRVWFAWFAWLTYLASLVLGDRTLTGFAALLVIFSWAWSIDVWLATRRDGA